MPTANPITQETLKWPPEGWLTKTVAAERLGLSESRVAALGSAGSIKTQGQRSPTSNQYVMLYHAGDVERVAYERQHPTEVPKLPVKNPSKSEVSRELAVILQANQEAFPSRPQKAWITIAEAAAYSGLPESTVKRLLECGALPGIDCGPRPGGKWRVKRSDLDALEGQR